MNNKIILKGGKICDLKSDSLIDADILIENSDIKDIQTSINISDCEVIDVSNKIVAPGFIDMHAHILSSINDVGNTIDDASKSALKGGFTTVCAMSNTNPPLDNEGMIGIVKYLSSMKGGPTIIPAACATKNSDGKEMTEIGMLVNAGAGLIYDAGKTIDNISLVKNLIDYTSMFDVLLCLYCEDKTLALDGLINESEVSTRLGLPGIPSVAESIVVARDVLLAEYLNARIHIAIISTKESVQLIKDAKARGVKVTCGTTHHHIDLTDNDIKNFDTYFKIRPPLRSVADRECLVEALKDGTIDVLVTDHTPCSYHAKHTEFAMAPFGVIGFETAFSVAYERLVKSETMSLIDLVKKMSYLPSKLLGLDLSIIEKGKEADLTVLDLQNGMTVKKETLVSRHKNTPYLGTSFSARVAATIKSGIVKYKDF